MRGFAGKVAVITGAASGIGRGLATCFAREDRFYILTHPEVKREVERRMQAILEDRPPSPQDSSGPFSVPRDRGGVR